MAAGGIVLGLALAGAMVLTGAPAVLALPALLLTYAVPTLLRVLSRAPLVGSAGRHEQPVSRR
jgi:hypothetical protein